MDNTQLIQELQTKNEELTKKLDELSNSFNEVKRILEEHAHTGTDGSIKVYNSDIALKSGTGISVGKYGFVDFEDDNQIFGITVVGDAIGQSGNLSSLLNSSQIIIEHQPNTNGTTNQTFYYGYRSPLYSGVNSGSVTSGGTTLSQNKFTWTTNELYGAYVIAYDSAHPTQFDFYEIASNTATQLTITGGTWTFTDVATNFYIIVPIYLGASAYPWRRVYTMDGAGGGIRFGGGDTNGGQNTLLYTEGDVLKFRLLNGDIKTVTLA